MVKIAAGNVNDINQEGADEINRKSRYSAKMI